MQRAEPAELLIAVPELLSGAVYCFHRRLGEGHKGYALRCNAGIQLLVDILQQRAVLAGACRAEDDGVGHPLNHAGFLKRLVKVYSVAVSASMFSPSGQLRLISASSS